MSDSTAHNLIPSRSHRDSIANGVSYEWEDDGWLHVHGTKSNGYANNILSKSAPVRLAAGTYTMSVEVEDGAIGFPYYFSLWTVGDERLGTLLRPMTIPLTFEAGAAVDMTVYLNPEDNGKAVDYRVRLMLVEGTTPAAWAPAEGEGLAGGGCVHER